MVKKSIKYDRTNWISLPLSGTKPISDSCWLFIPIVIPIFHKRAMDTRIPYYVMFITFYDYYESWYIAPFKKRTPDFDPIIFWWYSHHIPIRFTSCSHGPTSGDPGDPLRRSCRPSPWTPMLRAQWGGRGVEPRIEFPNHTIDEHVLEQKEVFFCPPKKHQTQIWLGSAFN